MKYFSYETHKKYVDTLPKEKVLGIIKGKPTDAAIQELSVKKRNDYNTWDLLGIAISPTEWAVVIQ